MLRPGGRLLVLEFSRVPEPSLALALRPLFVQRHPGARPGARRRPRQLPLPRRVDPPLPRPGDLRRHDRRRRLRPGPLPQPLDGHRRAALGLEALMRGPHNLWRLIRTGATFERTGAMSARARRPRRAAGAAGRGAGARLAVPVARARRRPEPAADPAGADRARAGLHQVRPAALDPARRRRPRARGRARPCCRTSCRPSRSRRRAPRSRPSSASRSRRSSPASSRRSPPPRSPRSTARRCATTGQVVAVKVLRPGIERAFLRDVDAFHFAATLIELLAPVRPAAAAARGDQPLRGGGAGRARPADGGLGRRRVRGEQRARPRLPGAGGDLARLRPAGADARMGLRASTSATCRRCAPPAST